MKRFYAYLTSAVLALTLLTSCDRDAMDAMTLDGVWSGTINTYYADRWGMESADYQTTFAFLREGTYSGIGYEEDYGYDGYYFARMTWEIRNGNIYMYYPDENFTYVIYGYTLSNNHFNGYIGDDTSRRISFSLRYIGGFDRGYYDGHYYSSWRTRSTADTTASDDVYVKGGTYATGSFARILKEREQ